MSRLIAQCARQGHPYTLYSTIVGVQTNFCVSHVPFSLLMDYMEIGIWMNDK